jgi:hypothetical protein
MKGFRERFVQLVHDHTGFLTKRFFDTVIYHFEDAEDVEFIRWFKPLVAHMRFVEPDPLLVFFEEYYPLFEEMQKLKNSNINYHD